MLTSLQKVAKQLVVDGKGIFAADQSPNSAGKLLKLAGVKSNIPKNRLKYRTILFTTKGIEEYISGVILHDETIRQKIKGIPIPKYLAKRGIIPGIKVDRGYNDLPNFSGEKYTKGLDDLPERLKEYKKLGAKFAKWRAWLFIGGKKPTDAAIETNAESLAEYAALCQREGMVPIVEPEVFMEGTHSMETSEIATTKVQKKVFEKLAEHKVDLTGILLKPNWIHPGLSKKEPEDVDVAKATLRVLNYTVPREVPGIVFLSGGDSPMDSTEHLEKINNIGGPWKLSFSFGRALQESALKVWAGKKENVQKAQQVFLERAKLNSFVVRNE